MAKWGKKGGDDGDDAAENQSGGLSRANAEFMTTIAGSLLGSLNIDVIMHFANAIRQLHEEEAEENAEALASGMSEAARAATKDEKKKAEREGLVLLNEV